MRWTSRRWPGSCARRRNTTAHTRREAPKHHWSGFYAAYIVAREEGRSPEEADQDARRYMDGVLAKQVADE